MNTYTLTMKLYVVVVDETFTRGNSYNYRHIRAYESKKRAENFAKGIEGARVVEFFSKESIDETR